jgi:hypothetical protein
MFFALDIQDALFYKDTITESPYLLILLVVFKSRHGGTMHPVTTATIKALTCFWLSGLWPESQATRVAGDR